MKGHRIVKKKAINSEKDPYLLKAFPHDRAICARCGAVYHDKRWKLLEKAPVAPAKTKAVRVVCPACQKIRDAFAAGYVTIQGGFLKNHRDDILRLIKNKEAHAVRYNPLDRIMAIRQKTGVIDVTTTTEKLAQLIGRMIKKAFAGKVVYKWSSDVKLARIIWTREEE